MTNAVELVPLPKAAPGWEEHIDKIRRALIKNPYLPNLKIEQEVNSSSRIVQRERRNLVRAGYIVDVGRENPKKGYNKYKQLNLPVTSKQLRETCSMFDTIVEYCSEMFTKMPPDCERAFTTPKNAFEIDLRWGFLTALRNIQKVAAALEGKYAEPHLITSIKNSVD